MFVALAAGAAILAVLPAGGHPGTDRTTAADPFPIQRVLLPTDRLENALRAASGSLSRMPRGEFEAKVKAAAAAVAAAENPPRLIEARYRASVIDGAMTGLAEWSFAYPGGGGVVQIDPLGPAVVNPRWQGGRPAVLFRKAGDSAALLIADDPGTATLSFGWTVRASAGPGADRFDIELPPAPVSVLELDVPADRVPVADLPDVAVSGPYPGAVPERRAWRVTFGGVGKMELAILRPPGTREPLPAVRSARALQYAIGTDECAANYSFAWEAIRGPVKEIAFRVDPGVRVMGVSTQRPTAWRFDPPNDKHAPGTLRVAYSEPTSSGTIAIVATAGTFDVPSEGRRLPDIGLLAGLPGADTIELHIDRGVRLHAIDPGDFRVTGALESEGEVGYRVDLAGTLVGEDSGRRLPQIQCRPVGPTFTSSEEVTWRPGPGRSELIGRFRLDVARGPVAEISVHATPGYVPRSIRFVPDDAGATWSAGGRPGEWVIEPSRPIPSGRTVELRIEFTGPPGPAPAGTADIGSVAFPRLGPIGAHGRDGSFTLLLSGGLQGCPSPLPRADRIGSAEGGAVAFAYPYRGSGPEGVLYLGPRPPRLVGSVRATVSQDGDETTATSHVRVRRADGAAEAVTLFLPDPPDGIAAWDVRSATGGGTPGPPTRADSVVWLGAMDGWSAVGRAALAEVSRGWVCHVAFPRPLRGEAEIVAAARWPAAAAGALTVPIPSIAGCVLSVAGVELAPSVAGRYAAPAEPIPIGFPTIVIAYPSGALPNNVEPTDRPVRLANATLATAVESDGRMTCELSGSVSGGGADGLPVILPAGAMPLEVVVNGLLVEPSEASTGSGRIRLDIPLPEPKPNEPRVEVRYRLPAPTGGPIFRFLSPSPELPSVLSALRRTWSFAAEFQETRELLPTGKSDRGQWDVAYAVRAGTLPAAGWAAAAVVVGLGAVVVSRHRRVEFLTVAAAAAGFAAAAWVLPSGWQPVLVPPLVVGLSVAAGFVRLSSWDHPGRQPSAARRRADVWPTPVPAAVAVVVGLFGVLVAVPVAAQAPEPSTVFLTPGSGGELEALVPKSVLDRLDAPVRPPAVGPSIVASGYEGTATESTVAFEAAYSVWNAGHGSDELILPLAGGKLLEVSVDGADGFPVTAGPDRYAIAVPGAGMHAVRVRFEVPIAAVGADREARFAGPDVPIAKVGFVTPPGGAHPDVFSRGGGQFVTAAGQGKRVEADHGGGRVVSVRWQTIESGTPAAISVRSACVWDLSEGEATAVAGFLLRVDGGSVSRFRFDIPDGLEPGRVAFRPTESRASGGLSEWSLSPGRDGWRTVELRLQSPFNGRAAVFLRLYPTRPLTGRTALGFPRWRDAEESEAYCAFRLNGVTADSAERVGAADATAEAVAREFASIPELGLERTPPIRVFRRTGADVPELKLSLRATTPPAAGSAETTWTLGARADAEGVVRCSSGAGDVSAVEFRLPSRVRIEEVRGTDVNSWGRLGDRVQVWLRKPTREPVVQWTGTLDDYPEAPANGKPISVDLPAAHGSGYSASVRVRAADGWAVAVHPHEGLTPSEDPEPGVTRYVGNGTAVETPVKVLAYPPMSGSVESSESVERTGSSAIYRAELSVGVPHDRPSAFKVQWPRETQGAELIGTGVAISGPENTPVGPIWTVGVPAGLSGDVRMELTARIAGDGSPLVPQPVVWFGPHRVTATRESLLPLRIPPASRGEESTPTSEPVPQAAAIADGTVAEVEAAGVGGVLPLVGWLVGFAAVASATFWSRSGRWWPEQWVGFGLLGLAVPGVGGLAAVACGLLSAAGGLARLGTAARRAAGLAFR